MESLLMNSFNAQNISFSYGKKKIFQHASLDIVAQQVTGLLGANGSGKTTFFDLMCGLNDLDSGTFNNPFNKFYYLSQTLTTSPALKMSDTFKMIAALTSSEPSSLTSAVKKLSQWSPGIVDRYKEIWSKKSAICSYGEKRWFFTLSLLSLDSDFFILDEPTAGVDPQLRYHIWQCLKGAASEGRTIFVSSNNVDEIVSYCDSFYMLHDLKFIRFYSAREYLEYYSGTSLDEAFINATLRTSPDKND